MTQTQTETSISNGRRRARTPAEILGESPRRERPKATQHYVWMGLNHGDVFYTLRADNLREMQAYAERLSHRCDIMWTVRFSISSDSYGNVPLGLGEHKLVNEDNGGTGRNSYLD